MTHAEVDAFHTRERAGGRSVYNFLDLIVLPRVLGPDGQPLDPNAPQLKGLPDSNSLARTGFC